MKFAIYFFSAFILTSAACTSGERKEPPLEEEERFSYDLPDYQKRADMPSMVKQMLNYHNFDDFMENEVIVFDLKLTLEGEEELNATIYSKTNSSKVKLARIDGSSVLYDGDEVYLSPDTADYPNARFDVLVWEYLALAPFKLAHDYTRWGQPERLPLYQDSTTAVKVSFATDSIYFPSEWFMVYQNRQSKLMEALGNIMILAAETVNGAENMLHAVTYSDYEMVDTTFVAGKLEFWKWTSREGIQDKVGEAEISDIRFSNEKPEMFSFPETFKLLPATE
ncbi:hypothetical protein JKA74_00170 [Marivirga sp. S37H4]|uniref:Uncharacterized protein n=1 Tax=Marivirga aurantiaca TaxID=2802615 RepID=A0A934WUZ3_9BACT|nr:hypothetical protein [Marivirga aurantiaca]MBK6263430.1 hypothetical protein [Marivirga aurantiaca]